MLDIAISIVVAIVAWFIIMLIGINLLGYVVRGLLWSPPPIDAADGSAGEELYKQEWRRLYTGNLVMTIVAIALTGACFFLLYYYWNIGLAIAAGIIMLSRLPDLLWEIRNGVKATKTTGPKLGYLFAMEFLISIPLVWYSLYHWPW